MTMQRRFDRSSVPGDITPPEVFFNRRRFMQAGLATIALGPAACASTASQDPEQKDKILAVPFEREGVFPAKRNDRYSIPAAIDRKELTDRLTAATHNNFYEFLPGRGGPVWQHTADFEVDPWTVTVGGECRKPKTFDLDDLFKFEQEERVYHFRCVERWAMNVPWTGFPLRKLLEAVEPTSDAKFIRFITANRPAQMPGMRDADYYPWPYFEGLRMDEAMNDLTLLATGIYGAPLLKQHGAPVRLVVPWKYGYKGAKSVTRIMLVREQPETFWRKLQPHEYGFLSNVNPNIPHPRWSQQESYWLGSEERFQTPIFNGYGEYVAELYPDEPRTMQEPLKPPAIGR